MTSKFWNEAIECISPEDQRRLEDERLRVQIAYNCRTSPFYAAKLADAGVKPEDIRSTADLPLIPFMEKSDIASSQAAGAFLGINQCAPLTEIVRVQATGGTSGSPMRIGLTRRDIEDYNEMGARASWTMGCRPGDIVFTCMNFSLYAGGLSDHLTFENLGSVTIPYSVGQSERLLAMMANIKEDVAIWATPSYAVRLADVARELGIEPRSVGLTKGYFSGEPGIQVPGYRERIEETWGMEAHDGYGTGELGLHSGECEHRQGFHYGATGIVYTELINPDTTEVLKLEDGLIGEAVYTSLRRQAGPLQRMRSHDLMQVFTEPCRCGRTSFRFKVLGRSDDMFIVKGVNVFPQAVQASLIKLTPRLTGEYQIVIEKKPPIDYPVTIRVEVANSVPQSERPALIAETTHRVQTENNFACRIELVAQGGIAATDRKTRRVIRSYLPSVS